MDKHHIPWNKGLTRETSERVNSLYTTERNQKIGNSLKRLGILPPGRKSSVPWNKGLISKSKHSKKGVLLRDDYTCQICSFRDPEIMEVDHIRQKALYPDLRLQFSNLQTLCPNCHRRKTLRDLRELTSKRGMHAIAITSPRISKL